MATVCEVIRPDESYTLGEFQRRTGMKEAAMKSARQRGLRVRYTGTRAYVLGKDWFAYLEEHADDEA